MRSGPASTSPRCTCGHLKAQHRRAPIGCTKTDKVGRFCACGEFKDAVKEEAALQAKKKRLKARPVLNMSTFLVELEEDKKAKRLTPKIKKPDPLKDDRAPRTWDDEV